MSLCLVLCLFLANYLTVGVVGWGTRSRVLSNPDDANTRGTRSDVLTAVAASSESQTDLYENYVSSNEDSYYVSSNDDNYVSSVSSEESTEWTDGGRFASSPRPQINFVPKISLATDLGHDAICHNSKFTEEELGELVFPGKKCSFVTFGKQLRNASRPCHCQPYESLSLYQEERFPIGTHNVSGEDEDSLGGDSSGGTGFGFRRMSAAGRKGRPGYRAGRWKTRPEPPKRAPKLPRGRLDSARNQQECEGPRRCSAQFAVGNQAGERS